MGKPMELRPIQNVYIRGKNATQSPVMPKMSVCIGHRLDRLVRAELPSLA